MTQLRSRQSTSALDQFFRITERGSSLGREVRGGITTFVAMSYIVLLNPLILGASADITGVKLTIAEITTATALAAGVMTVLMGLVGNAPLAIAAGLGVNGVVAFQMAPVSKSATESPPSNVPRKPRSARSSRVASMGLSLAIGLPRLVTISSRRSRAT